MIVLPSLPNILALDPGGTTGFCWYCPSGQYNRGPDRGHIGPHEHHDELYRFLGDVYKASVGIPQQPEQLHIVCESFEFRRTERHRDFIDYIPREYIGVVKLFYQRFRSSPGIQPASLLLTQQTAMQAKNFFDDDKVKALGLWVPGKKHAMDATRHYLYYRTFTLGDKSLLQQLR